MKEEHVRILRRSRIAAIVIGVFIAAFGWGLYVAVVVFHVHLTPHEQGMHVEASEPTIALVLACAATVISIAVTAFSLRKSMILLRRGAEGQARVVKVSLAKKNGMRPVTYAFSVDGKEYVVRRDTDAVDADRYDDTTVVSVVYDPVRPARCRIMK